MFYHQYPFILLLGLFSFTICFTAPSAVHVQSAPPSTIPADLLDTRTRPYNRLTITTPNGSLPLLQSIKVPNLGIANVWPNGGRIPDWVRPIDLTTVNLLLDLVIARYATRPSEEATGYGTVGPETAPPLRDLDTRVVVKPYFESLGTPGKALAPLRNKEVAYAAQMVRWLYSFESRPKKECGWVLLYLTEPKEEGGRQFLDYSTGVFLVQRDLWFAGEDKGGGEGGGEGGVVGL